MSNRDERIIFAFKLQSKANPDKGDIRPIAELEDGKLTPITRHDFCHTLKVFVTTSYPFIDEKFKDGQIFRINVTLSEQMSSIVDPYQASRYVTIGNKAERLKPNELIEIIDGELPNRNYRYLENSLSPSTDYIFIRNTLGECLGPFSWECKDENTGFELHLLNDTPLLKSYKLSSGQILKIAAKNVEKYATKCPTEEKTYHLVFGLSEFLTEYEYFDYASDEEIVKHCAKLASDVGAQIFNKKSWDSFKQLAANNVKFSQALNKTRLKQISELATELNTAQEEIREHIEIFLASQNGEKLVQEFVERKRPQLTENLRKSVIKEKSDEINAKEQQLNHFILQIDEKNKALKALNAEIEKQRKEANQEAILEQAVAERNRKLQHLDLAITEKEKENTLLETTTSRLKIERDKTENELRAKLMELKPFVDHINGAFFFSKTQKERTVFVQTHAISASAISEKQRCVIETVKHNLSLKGRDFETWQIANLLISTQQSFITFLAGLPGVGKTSLARLIVQAQQLEPRLQEVSVARGWASQKDLIGFYNPLSNRFQSSNTGLYGFIEALSLEDKKDDAAMAYVLLDEANLSPIEHYWSAFMGMTDGEGERVLHLGEEKLAVPKTLRFLATINYDGTTEPLSPRVVDRAPVLVMDSQHAPQNKMPSSNQKMIPLPLTANDMNTLFGFTNTTPAFQEYEKNIFSQIRDILSHPDLEKGRPLSISQRKEMVIRQYCAKAGTLMRSLGCDNVKALDLAVLQHVLPQVRGNGQKFAKRLIQLKQTCDESGLTGSAHYLDRMLAYGETELHSYDFFCW